SFFCSRDAAADWLEPLAEPGGKALSEPKRVTCSPGLPSGPRQSGCCLQGSADASCVSRATNSPRHSQAKVNRLENPRPHSEHPKSQKQKTTETTNLSSRKFPRRIQKKRAPRPCQLLKKLMLKKPLLKNQTLTAP